MPEKITVPNRGDVREDGYIFDHYATSRHGRPYQVWRHPKYYARMAQYHKNRKQAKRDYDKEYRKIHADKLKADKRNDFLRNRDRLKLTWGERGRASRMRHPHTQPIITARRRARIKNATTAAANPKIIRMFYIIAQRLHRCIHIKHEVDHITPIAKGGLHHQDNLQVLPAAINRLKSARLDFNITPL